MDEKKWYLSKTLWVNFIGFAGAVLVATGVLAVEISPETVVIILAVINAILRFITKEPVVWSAK